MRTYQDVYPSAPELDSAGLARQSAAELLTCEYFEAEPASMPVERFSQHHVLINLHPEPMRVENWRDGAHRDFMFQPSEIVLTPAGVESGWRWHARSKCIVITCEPHKLARFAREELSIALTEDQLKDTQQFVDEDLTQAALQLVDALRSSCPGSAVIFESLARVFLVKLIFKYGMAEAEDYAFTRQFTARHYQAVMDLVERNYGRRVQLEDMAEAAGLSPYHFARLFKTTIGVAPYQFVMRYRVERAAGMLADPDRPLIDIALACGFSDQAHFARTFKSITGVTPTQHRRGLQQDPSNE